MNGIPKEIMLSLRKAGFWLDQRSDTEEAEWHLMRNDGSDTGAVIRDWSNANLGFAILHDGKVLVEGLQLRQALNHAIELLGRRLETSHSR